MNTVSAIILSVGLSLLAMTIGAMLTYLVTRHYYEAASKDLKKEAGQLRRLNTAIARGLEESGLARFTRDKQGNIIGIVVTLQPKSTRLSPKESGKLTVQKRPKSD